MISGEIKVNSFKFGKFFHDGDPDHIEISPLICRANIIGTPVMNDLILKVKFGDNP